MPVTTIASKEEFQAACNAAGTKKLAIDFHAAWCGPCKIIGPKFKTMSDESKYSNIVFLKVDVDEAEDVAEKFGISAMPTFIITDNTGTKLDEVVGANDIKLKELIEKYC